MCQGQAQSFVTGPGNMKKAPALLLQGNLPVVEAARDQGQTIISEQFRYGYAAVLSRPPGPGAGRGRHLFIVRDGKRLALVIGIRCKWDHRTQSLALQVQHVKQKAIRLSSESSDNKHYGIQLMNG